MKDRKSLVSFCVQAVVHTVLLKNTSTVEKLFVENEFNWIGINLYKHAL